MKTVEVQKKGDADRISKTELASGNINPEILSVEGGGLILLFTRHCRIKKWMKCREYVNKSDLSVREML